MSTTADDTTGRNLYVCFLDGTIMHASCTPAGEPCYTCPRCGHTASVRALIWQESGLLPSEQMQREAAAQRWALRILDTAETCGASVRWAMRAIEAVDRGEA